MYKLAKNLILFISVNLLLANGSLSLSDNGDGTWDVGYVTDTADVIYFDPDKTWVELS